MLVVGVESRVMPAGYVGERNLGVWSGLEVGVGLIGKEGKLGLNRRGKGDVLYDTSSHGVCTLLLRKPVRIDCLGYPVW